MIIQSAIDRGQVARVSDTGVDERRASSAVHQEIGVVAVACHRSRVEGGKKYRREHSLKTIAEGERRVRIESVLSEEVVGLASKERCACGDADVPAARLRDLALQQKTVSILTNGRFDGGASI